MANRIAKWLIYTIAVGFIPALFRMLVWFISQDKTGLDLFNALDFIVLGLVLQISNINEIEHLYDSERTWKTTHNGISVILIIFYSALLVFHLLGESIPESIDGAAVKSLAMATAPLSIALSFMVYYRVSKLEEARNND